MERGHIIDELKKREDGYIVNMPPGTRDVVSRENISLAHVKPWFKASELREK